MPSALQFVMALIRTPNFHVLNEMHILSDYPSGMFGKKQSNDKELRCSYIAVTNKAVV